ncbi:MAG: type II toxin-antitoxin system RelE/ParE family toxin [Planctomycetota bacterium]
MTFRFLSPAQADIASAADYYEKAVPGLGLDFLDEIERTIQRILLQPEAWAQISPNHRRCRMHRFPYGLLYSIEGDSVVISAVMDLRRHPDAWSKRTS